MLQINADQAQKIIDRYEELNAEKRAGKHLSNERLQAVYDAADLCSDHLNLAAELGQEKSEITILLSDDLVSKLYGWLY